MIFPRVLSCAVLLLLLVAVLSRGRRCSITKILRQYRAVIFHEIQNLRNLTGSVYRIGRAGPACRSDKDQRILMSIYNISMSLQEVGAGTLQGSEELAVWRVARTTNFVFQENCRRISKVGLLWDGCGRNLEHQNIGKKKGKERTKNRSSVKLLKAKIYSVINAGGSAKYLTAPSFGE
ncbi:hypothetical protein HGM15179_006339 [Zosterops borbonicus]|uniref:Uncharacterized protein n=1 Tax=Zosterops borbonicus TaxID=364589 RepID=A0A8K1GN57_9PASS|nr:hypothetical protein HGM15179_006339 [Zosterops borbonicus]